MSEDHREELWGQFRKVRHGLRGFGSAACVVRIIDGFQEGSHVVG